MGFSVFSGGMNLVIDICFVRRLFIVIIGVKMIGGGMVELVK